MSEISAETSTATNPSSYMFLNKKTIIIGKPNTGKTTLVLDILRTLGNSFAEYVIVSDQHENYRHVINTEQIYSTLSTKELQNIWEKASYHKITAELCNNGKVLRSLCNKIDKYNNANNTIIKPYPKGPNFAHFKQKIRDNSSIFSKLNLDPDEYVVCHKLDTKSKMCLIIDGGIDLLDDWDKYKPEENVALNLIGLSDFKDLTMVVTCADDNKLSANVFRKMDNVILTDKITTVMVASKVSRGFSNSRRKECLMLSSRTFADNSYNKIMISMPSYTIDVICASETKIQNKNDDLDDALQKLLQS